MGAGFDESSTRSSNITSTVFDKCIIKLALADAGGKFRRQGGRVMFGEAIGEARINPACAFAFTASPRANRGG
jgi:hypothetical protein